MDSGPLSVVADKVDVMTGWMFLVVASTLLVGVCLGAAVAALALRTRHLTQTARLQTERDLLAERVEHLDLSTAESRDLDMALAPLSSALARMERQVGDLERGSAAHWGRLGEQLTSVATSGRELRRQTAELAGALRSGGVRGSWGEVQLRRVVEHAGLLARVDFTEQAQSINDDGDVVRPDAVVHLPGGKHIVIDAKAPLADDDSGQAKAVRAHVASLARKRYWTAFDPSPEFVVCFVPSEGLLAGACRADPVLLDDAMASRVVIATPTTLLAMLRTVALTWQQDALVGNAHAVVDLGRQLHERLQGLGVSLAKLGRTIDRAVADYNTVVAQTEGQLLRRARQLGELGVSEQPVPPVPSISRQARTPVEYLRAERAAGE